MVSLYIGLNPTENKDGSYGTTHFNSGGPMDTGYPALIAELPSKENGLNPPEGFSTAKLKNLPSIPTNPEETASPPTTETPS